MQVHPAGTGSAPPAVGARAPARAPRDQDRAPRGWAGPCGRLAAAGRSGMVGAGRGCLWRHLCLGRDVSPAAHGWHCQAVRIFNKKKPGPVRVGRCFFLVEIRNPAGRPGRGDGIAGGQVPEATPECHGCEAPGMGAGAARPSGRAAGPKRRSRALRAGRRAGAPRFGGTAQTILIPAFSASVRNCARPLSVSTWLAMALITAGGAVATSAPILAHSDMWLGERIEAARIWVSNP